MASRTVHFLDKAKRGVIATALWIGCSLHGEVDSVPLLAGEEPIEGEELAGRLWRLDAAHSALTSGFSSIAARLYGEALESGDFSGKERDDIILCMVSALINEGRNEEASKWLDKYKQVTEPSYRLRLAILEYEKGNLDRTTDLLDMLRVEKLPSEERGWYFLLSGLIREERQDPIGAESFYERARDASGSEAQSTLFETILFRNRLLFLRPGQLDENLVTDLRAKVEASPGLYEGFQSAKVLAVVLHELGREFEAITVIEDQLRYESVHEGDLEDEFLLLLGLVAGRDTARGKEAFRELLSKDGNRKLQKIGLQILADTGQDGIQNEEIGKLLDDLVERPTAHSLIDQLYYFRAQLSSNNGQLMAAQADANQILENFPGSRHTNDAIRLLAYISWMREPPQYRMAADYLNRLRSNLPDGPEKSRLSILVADSYYRNGDYENAADAYGAAFREKGNEAVRGSLLFQQVMSEIGAGNLEAAIGHLDDAAESGGFDSTEVWRAEWNLISKMKGESLIERAFARVRELLIRTESGEVAPELRLRLMWLEAQLSIEADRPEETPAMIARILTELAKVPIRAIGPQQREEIISHTLLLHGQALFAVGREEQGLKIFEELSISYPTAESTKLSYLMEAGYLTSISKFAAAQQRLIALADDFPESKYAVIALWEAAEIAKKRNTKREAGKILQDLVKKYPNHEFVFYARLKQGDLSRELDDFASAQSVYEDLISQYPEHPERFRAEISLADCFLAQSSINTTRLGDAEAILERLFDLPNVPIDLRAEAGLKWGFSLAKSGHDLRAEEVYWLMINRLLKDPETADMLGARGRYWVARAVFELGELLEGEVRYEDARGVYALISQYGLPGRATAVANTERFSGRQK